MAKTGSKQQMPAKKVDFLKLQPMDKDRLRDTRLPFLPYFELSSVAAGASENFKIACPDSSNTPQRRNATPLCKGHKRPQSLYRCKKPVGGTSFMCED
jgi:hypothetical protein